MADLKKSLDEGLGAIQRSTEAIGRIASLSERLTERYNELEAVLRSIR